MAEISPSSLPQSGHNSLPMLPERSLLWSTGPSLQSQCGVATLFQGGTWCLTVPEKPTLAPVWRGRICETWCSPVKLGPPQRNLMLPHRSLVLPIEAWCFPEKPDAPQRSLMLPIETWCSPVKLSFALHPAVCL